MSYHNTLKLDFPEIRDNITTSKVQDKRILHLITNSKKEILTPRIIWKEYIDTFNQKILLTSVRRSINTLIKIGLVEYDVQENGKNRLHYHFCRVDYTEVREWVIKLKQHQKYKTKESFI